MMGSGIGTGRNFGSRGVFKGGYWGVMLGDFWTWRAVWKKRWRCLFENGAWYPMKLSPFFWGSDGKDSMDELWGLIILRYNKDGMDKEKGERVDSIEVTGWEDDFCSNLVGRNGKPPCLCN